MIRLRSARQALELRDRIPGLAVTRMQQFEGIDGLYDPEIDGHIIVLEEGDDITQIPEVGRKGLLGIIDPEWPGYEYIEAVQEEGRRVFEVVIPIDDAKTVAIIIPDRPWLDERIRQVLDQEAEISVAILPASPRGV